MYASFNSIESGRKRVRNWLASEFQFEGKGDTRQAPALNGKQWCAVSFKASLSVGVQIKGKQELAAKWKGFKSWPWWVARKRVPFVSTWCPNEGHKDARTGPSNSIIDATGKVPKLGGRHSSTCSSKLHITNWATKGATDDAAWAEHEGVKGKKWINRWRLVCRLGAVSLIELSKTCREKIKNGQ